jgi:outer membrane protein assembly factor BamB
METMLMRSIVFSLLLAFAGSPALAAEWPEFRGPDGQGHSSAKNLPLEWSETENVAWKTELPGRGWSSPVIAGDQIWLTYAVTDPISEEDKQKKLTTNTGNQPLEVVGTVRMHAVCVDRNSGKIVRDMEILVEDDPQWTHALNTFASPTPVLSDDGLLYCHFGAHGTACVDTKTMRVKWTNRETKVLHENGPGSSPVLYQDKLIFHCDGSDEQYIVALDAHTGKIAWKTDRTGQMHSNPQLRKAYGTPIVLPIDGRATVISPAANWLYGYDPLTGQELWKTSYGVLGFSIVCRPVYGQGQVYLSTTFNQPELLAIKVDDASVEPSITWRTKKGAPQMPSLLLVDKDLFMVNDKGVATCLDAATGEVHWTERLGGNFSSSPLYADGRIYVSNREGETFVLAPGQEFKLLATNQLDGAIMASPAVVGEAIYLRTEHALYRLEKKATD